MLTRKGLIKQEAFLVYAGRTEQLMPKLRDGQSVPDSGSGNRKSSAADGGQPVGRNDQLVCVGGA